jgi:hypothetical protein
MENSEQFKQTGYAIVKNAISDELRDFITQYALFDEMQNFHTEEMTGSFQVPKAHSKYADPAMESLLLNLHSIMEKNTGLELYPTYSYFRVYRPGDELKIHKDRPSCEISSTLCFNYSYDQEKYQWPIYMNGNKIVQSPGDMAIYRGCDLDHWRDLFDLEEDVWHVQGFFHFVDKNGPFSDHKFDRRETIGENQKNFSVRKNLKPYIEFMK